jgi:tetratricopeptide (TPR) repeat protein
LFHRLIAGLVKDLRRLEQLGASERRRYESMNPPSTCANCSGGASSQQGGEPRPLPTPKFALAAELLCIVVLPAISLLSAQVPTQPRGQGGGLVLISPGTSDFTTKADELIKMKRWAEAKSLLIDGVRQMPPNWSPIEIPAGASASIERVIVHSWDSDEYIAFANKNPTYGRGRSSNVWQRPSYSRAFYLIAYIEEELGNFGEASDALDQGLKLEPDHPMLLAEKAFLYQKQKQYDAALNLYKQAAARVWASSAQIAHALRGQGYCLVELGQLDAAETAYRRSLELQPGNLTAINELGYITTHRQRPAGVPFPTSGRSSGITGAGPRYPSGPQRIRVATNLQEAMLLTRVAPNYPPFARQARVQGGVRFTAIIGTDGEILNLTFISGPALLKDAAAEAVRKWIYKPTLLNGQPVEVVTQIDVEFKLVEAGPTGISSPRIDGIYQSVGKNPWQYLRFSSDGTVVVTTSDIPPEMVTRIIQQTTIPAVKFILDGGRIRFAKGELDYEGTVQNDGIDLTSHGKDNQTTSTHFRFVLVAGATIDLSKVPVAVAFQTEDGSDLPSDTNWPTLSLISLGFASRGAVTAIVPSPNGAYRISGVPRAQYRLQLINPPAGYYVKSVRTQGSRLGLTPIIDITALNTVGPVKVEVMLGRSAVDLSGVVLNQRGEPAAGALVTIAPESAEPGGLVALISATCSSLTGTDGRFTLACTIPGTYRVQAWEYSGPSSPIVNPDFRAHVLSATRVTLGANLHENVELKTIPLKEISALALAYPSGIH